MAVLGKNLEVDHYCVRFPVPGQSNAPLLKVVGFGDPAPGEVRVFNLDTNDYEMIKPDEPVLIIHQ